MARYFTLSEAQALLPGVENLIRQAMALKADYQAADTEMKDISRTIMMSGGSQVNHGKVVGIKARKDSSLELLKQVLERLQDSGCLIKDLDIGLLDFPTLYRGNEVYLCWRLGEEQIEWWHGVDEGFKGRKKIDDDFLANHRGEQLD
jgi:hypothetical protein